jgi:putative DNA primase/helicase
MIFPMSETIPLERQDRALLGKLERELPGVFNWAVEGLAMLLRDGFIESDAMGSAKLDHRQSVNPVLLWLEEATEAHTANESDLSKLHESYATWVRAAGNQPLSRSNFEKELERQGYRVMRPRLANGTRPRIVRGLKAL